MRTLCGCLLLLTLLGLCSQSNGDIQDNEPRGLEDQKAMATDAEQTYLATKAAYDAGTIPSIEPVYIWSRRWMESKVALASSAKERRDALQAHRDRMKDLDGEINAKFNIGAHGGEAEKKHAADFYFSESELLLKK